MMRMWEHRIFLRSILSILEHKKGTLEKVYNSATPHIIYKNGELLALCLNEC